MALPTQAQINTIIRYAGVSIVSLLSLFAAIGAIDPNTSAAIVAQIHIVSDDLQKLIGDSWKLGLLVGPVIVVLLAKIGYTSASPDSQKKSVASQPNTMVVETTNRIKTANTLAALPEVQQVTAPRSVANITPSPKVVS